MSLWNFFKDLFSKKDEDENYVNQTVLENQILKQKEEQRQIEEQKQELEDYQRKLELEKQKQEEKELDLIKQKEIQEEELKLFEIQNQQYLELEKYIRELPDEKSMREKFRQRRLESDKKIEENRQRLLAEYEERKEQERLKRLEMTDEEKEKEFWAIVKKLKEDEKLGNESIGPPQDIQGKKLIDLKEPITNKKKFDSVEKDDIVCQQGISEDIFHFVYGYYENSSQLHNDNERDEIPGSYYFEMIKSIIDSNEEVMYENDISIQDLEYEIELTRLVRGLYAKNKFIPEDDEELISEHEDEIIVINYMAEYKYYFEDDECCDIDIESFLKDQTTHDETNHLLMDTMEYFMFPLYMYVDMCRKYNLDSAAFALPEIDKRVSFLGFEDECIILNDINMLQMDDKLFGAFVEYVCSSEEGYRMLSVDEEDAMEFAQEMSNRVKIVGDRFEE